MQQIDDCSGESATTPKKISSGDPTTLNPLPPSNRRLGVFSQQLAAPTLELSEGKGASAAKPPPSTPAILIAESPAPAAPIAAASAPRKVVATSFAKKLAKQHKEDVEKAAGIVPVPKASVAAAVAQSPPAPAASTALRRKSINGGGGFAMGKGEEVKENEGEATRMECPILEFSKNSLQISPSIKCVFLGYGKNQKGYRCYDPSTDRMYVTMNCDFVESEYFYSQSSGQGESETENPNSDALNWLPLWGETIQGKDSQGENNQTTLPDQNPVIEIGPTEEVSSTTGQSNPQEQNMPVQDTAKLSDQSLNPEVNASDPNIGTLLETTDSDMENRSDTNEPPTEQETGHDRLPQRSTRGIPPRRYSPDWKGRKSRYCVANLTLGHLTEMARAFEAALYEEEEIPQSFEEVYGVDYEETFSPVAKLNTVRALLSVAACKEWPLYQFDVTNAFLHGELEKDKEVYMEVPPGFCEEFGKGQVCRLRKTLYGLKQSPRVWFGRFCQAMFKHGFKQSHSDHTLFLKKRNGKMTCLIIYVDDMIITGDDAEEIQNLKENLFREFEMKDLGALKYFLGIEVLRSKHGIFLRKKKYVLDMLAETGLLDCKPAETPMIPNHGLKIVDGAKPTDRERYQRLVGKLIYLSHTRPDITYAVGVVSQFMHQPQEDHMDAVMRIVRYLKGTTSYGKLDSHRHGEVSFSVTIKLQSAFQKIPYSMTGLNMLRSIVTLSKRNLKAGLSSSHLSDPKNNWQTFSPKR
ncbi:uncharacterized protein LOC121766776 [Salvia splendens]|uniref:uncharacterized protein LOC121766776 n=1 Tax=Salvia splendens TaxID=180675 RepID=UPI001C2626EB|nr:uncharacterized protein LOC121766776 [Salvia splendens]